MDPSARKIHAAKFSQGKASVLVVTDVAARGIDIPQLDNVINFNFPAKSKLFVHRVGELTLLFSISIEKETITIKMFVTNCCKKPCTSI